MWKYIEFSQKRKVCFSNTWLIIGDTRVNLQNEIHMPINDTRNARGYFWIHTSSIENKSVTSCSSLIYIVHANADEVKKFNKWLHLIESWIMRYSNVRGDIYLWKQIDLMYMTFQQIIIAACTRCIVSVLMLSTWYMLINFSGLDIDVFSPHNYM